MLNKASPKKPGFSSCQKKVNFLISFKRKTFSIKSFSTERSFRCVFDRQQRLLLTIGFTDGEDGVC